MARRLQQREGADDIGVNEGCGPVDRAVDMDFGRKMQHRIGLMSAKTRSSAAASQMSAFSN